MNKLDKELTSVNYKINQAKMECEHFGKAHRVYGLCKTCDKRDLLQREPNLIRTLVAFLIVEVLLW